MFGYFSKENILFVYGKVIGKKWLNDKKYSFVLIIKILFIGVFNMQVLRFYFRGEINYFEEYYKLFFVFKSNLFVVVED